MSSYYEDDSGVDCSSDASSSEDQDKKAYIDMLFRLEN